MIWHPKSIPSFPSLGMTLGKRGRGEESGRRMEKERWAQPELPEQQELNPGGSSQNLGDHRVCTSFFQEGKPQAKI